MVATVGRCYTNPQDYAQENYYTQGDALSNAEWFGQAAKIQGLTEQIQEKHFHNAYQALDPEGNPLRKQQNYRKQSKRQNRPGTDVTLSAPKSISVAALVMGNTPILEAHKSAVRATMDYVEKHCIFYQTKQQGQKKLLQSNTAQIAIFHHDDNRNKDPQLHSHCVILNQTQCHDGKWRAVANAQLYTQQKTIGAYYAHELVRQLKVLGWEVEWTDDHTFELAGVNKEKLDAIFSTRSNQIEAELAKLGLTRKTATAEQKQVFCLKTRKEKRYHLEPEDRERQLAEWKQKATEAGIEMTFTPSHRLENTYQQPSHPGSIPQLIHSATEILTERTTAFHSHELLKECLRQSQGNYDVQEIQSELAHFSQLIPTHDGRLTTQGQLKREQKIIQLVQQTQDSCSPLANLEQVQAISQTRGLNPGQTVALNHIATSRNGVVLVQGNAGVGKTYTMKAFKDLIDEVTLEDSLQKSGEGITESGIEGQNSSSQLLYGRTAVSPYDSPPFAKGTVASGLDEGQGDRETRGQGDKEIRRQGFRRERQRSTEPNRRNPNGDKENSSINAPLVQIRGLAPSAAAADVLQSKSGISSQTLASYLLTPNEQLPNQEILLVDEAGMLSTKQMEQLLEKTQAKQSRLILLGDSKQLSAVEAGAPFKLLQDQGLPTAIIDQNLRQRDSYLKQVVDLMATHDQDQDSINQAYLKLYEHQKIRQIPQDKQRSSALTQDYLTRSKDVRDRTLILAGTNADKQAITQTVRQGLIEEGTLGQESLTLQTLKRKDIDKFALTQAHAYQRGDVIKFKTESAQFSRDFYYRVTEVNPQANALTLIDTTGVDYTLPLNQYKQREVYQVHPIEIRPGEQMRFTKNIRNQEQNQLNGQRFTIEGVTEDGQVVIQTKGKTQTLTLNQLLHSDYRYVDTVHSSQGQTADYCIYSASAAKSLTVGRESFYVAASRARQEFVVYTANAQDLGVTVQISRANENAIALVNAGVSQSKKKKKGRDKQKHQESSVSLSKKPTFVASPSQQEVDNLDKEGQQEADNLDKNSTKQLQLTDAELITLTKAIEEWKKTCPREPSLHQGEQLKQQLDTLKQEKAKTIKQLRQQQKELGELGQPRSLLNPFGVKAEVIDALKLDIGTTQIVLSNLERQLSQADAKFKKWQKEARAYLSWRENPKTQQMQQKIEYWESPPIQEKLQQLKEKYRVYAQVKYILNTVGEPRNNPQYFQGKFYQISQQGDTLTVTNLDTQEPIFIATDKRGTGGIVEIKQLNLNEQDLTRLDGYVNYLRDNTIKQQQKTRSKGFSLG
ncbi:MobF family relaxase [Crocosphaera sp. XPORK-15E]|uniref:MobF family relaxase n=1 Tax=Crocosphaera sp. XPORK-15E TaxID=3110247 RepID=UPI002B2082DD|nr:MobF family relaxase [Crocosphaera sp. XPORK-15E]MEA5536867.1 MobF family relaxase [Crocosphaera sp. XPORK-15E]